MQMQRRGLIFLVYGVLGVGWGLVVTNWSLHHHNHLETVVGLAIVGAGLASFWVAVRGNAP